MDWRYQYNEAWDFEDLTEEEKEYALECGCEPGVKYYGDPEDQSEDQPDDQNEGYVCPLCGEALEDQFGCDHMVFSYELVNYQYMMIWADFEDYFWNKWFPNNKEKVEGWEEILEDDQKELPAPGHLKGIEGLQIVSYWNGYEGAKWGIANEELLKKISEG